MTTASGIGSWPGTDVRETVRLVRDTVPDLPYLPELPQRGPGADLVGRGAGLLVDLPVDLQPSGWRLVDRPGRDSARTASLMRQDLDELAEAYDGWEGALKLQVPGPWTLASGVWLGRGERVLVDPGAARELTQSLAEGVSRHLETVQRLVPRATLVLQVDEPSLPAVLGGRLPTASGYGRVRSVDPTDALEGLREVLAAAGSRQTVVHCCAPDAPLPLLRRTVAGLALDTALLGPRGWEGVAVAVDEGLTLYAGSVPTSGEASRPQDLARELVARWERLDLPSTSLDRVVVTPSCGLGTLSADAARRAQRLAVETAAELTELVAG